MQPLPEFIPPPAVFNVYEIALLARAALDVFQIRLAHFGLLALGFADDEGAATNIFGLIKFVVRQWVCSVLM
jgi:hypothetical protein